MNEKYLVQCPALNKYSIDVSYYIYVSCCSFSQRLSVAFDHHCIHHIAKKGFTRKRTAIRCACTKTSWAYIVNILKFETNSSLNEITSSTSIDFVFRNVPKVCLLDVLWNKLLPNLVT